MNRLIATLLAAVCSLPVFALSASAAPAHESQAAGQAWCAPKPGGITHTFRYQDPFPFTYRVEGAKGKPVSYGIPDSARIGSGLDNDKITETFRTVEPTTFTFSKSMTMNWADTSTLCVRVKTTKPVTCSIYAQGWQAVEVSRVTNGYVTCVMTFYVE